MIIELLPATMAAIITQTSGGAGRTKPNFVVSQKNAHIAIIEKMNPVKPIRMPRGAAAATSESWRRNALPARMTVRAIAPKNGIAGVRTCGEMSSKQDRQGYRQPPARSHPAHAFA
jgi:hypothetical protein